MTDRRAGAANTQALLGAYVAQARDPDRHGEHWAGPPEMVERIAALLGTASTDRVLDLGCGVGGPARRLAEVTGCEVVAVDVLEPVLRCAVIGREPNRLAVGRIRYAAADALYLPFGEALFDQVWCLGVVAHIRSVEDMARGVVRVLAPGGAAVFTEAFCADERRPRFAASSPWPWHALSSARLASQLRSAGLREVRVHPWPGGSSSFGDISHTALREDLLDGRLEPAMVVGRNR